MPDSRRPVVAIGLDAFERTLMARLIDEGSLPHLAGLLERGSLVPLRAPADLGSGAVWPTMVSGLSPASHGIHGLWSWSPETMTFRDLDWSHLVPFWKKLAEEGRRVLVLDVPFAPVIGHPNLHEIFDWGAHDTLGGETIVSPQAIASIVAEVGAHPLLSTAIDADGRNDRKGLERSSRLCREGARLRGDLVVRLLETSEPELAVIVFPEIHRAGHLLWHTLETSEEKWLTGIIEEVDVQIGRILERDVQPVIFALHGMRPTRGIPAILPSLLLELGYATSAPVAERTWRDRAATAAIEIKKRIPPSLKKIYYRSLPRAVTTRLAQPIAPLTLDWTRTRAFSIPTDQHGWVRLSVRGREHDGIVNPADYEALRGEIRSRLLALRTPTGEPIVDEILFTSETPGDATFLLPDLVIHWSDAAEASPLRLEGWESRAIPTGTKFSSQHDTLGFCILPPGEIPASGEIDARDLGAILTSLLGSA